MRHRKKGKILGRTSQKRRAMMRNLTASVFMYGSVKTTEAKAKTVQPIVEKLITIGKKGDQAAQRRVNAYLKEPAAQKALFDAVPRYKERNGGYTRIVRVGKRVHDGATMARIALID
ncbi:50S ribosomal protein L17 [Patescibacteria group bacterium]